MSLDPKFYPLLAAPHLPMTFMALSVVVGRQQTGLVPVVLFWLYALTSASAAMLYVVFGFLGAAFSRESHRRTVNVLDPHVLALIAFGLAILVAASYLVFTKPVRTEGSDFSVLYFVPAILSSICGVAVAKFLLSSGR